VDSFFVVRAKVIPGTYMNSTRGLKAFTGENGARSATSLQRGAVMKWAFETGEKFSPHDEHRGRNTGYRMAPLRQMIRIWDPYENWVETA